MRNLIDINEKSNYLEPLYNTNEVGMRNLIDINEKSNHLANLYYAVNELKNTVAEMKAAQKQGNEDRKRMLNTLSDWDGDGMPMERAY